MSVAEPGARPRRMSQPWVEVVDAADAPESTERPAPGVAAVTADAITPSQPGLEARLLAPVDAASSTAVPALSHEPQSLADLALPDEPERAEEGDEAEDEGPDPYLGSVISDRYVVDELIGEGGMGKVYRAHHKVIGKQVALKILHVERAKDKEAVGRFAREAKAASSIGNPHIVDISDFGEASDGATYFAMEYLEGGTLGDRIEEGPMAPELVCEISLQLCDGLAAAHEQQIVHRDLKPDNITLVPKDGGVFCKILDFGIAKVSTSSSSTKLTMAGAVFGTPHYMSPEQAAGDPLDHRTDIYSLGIMMYEMLASKLPFTADNFMGILTQHMYKAPLPINERDDCPECPRGLEAIVLKCLSKSQDARYPTMSALAADIRRFQAGEVPVAVEDLMARSGAFDVPPEYFKTGAYRAVVVPPRRWGPRIAALVGVLVAVGVVLFVIAKDATSVAQPVTNPTTSESPRDTPSTAPGPAAPVRHEVLLHATPTGSRALIRGEQVDLPTLVEVEEGKPITVEISADAHETRVIELDGSSRKVEIILDPLEAPSASATADKPPVPVPFARPPKSQPKPNPATVDGVVDPWAK